MPGHIYTIEELMLDDSFISYCLSTGAAVPSEWRKIIRENPDQERTFEEAKKIVLALHGGLGRIEVNRQIEIVRQQLKQRNSTAESRQLEESPSLSSDFIITDKGEIKRRIVKRILSYVLTASLLVVAGWWFFLKSAPQSEKPLVQEMSYQSPLGQRQTINLPDGSVVILNSNSQVQLADDFNTTKREIHLTGDAFFKVAKDAKKPFIVYAGNIVTTALGTEFYIHSKDNSVQVDLLEGKVKVENIKKNVPGTSLVLFPGETGRISGETNLLKQSFDSLQLRSWLNGRLSFNETPLPKVLKQLEAWYDVEIKVRKSELKGLSLNGDYQDAPLQDILKVICFSLNSRYTFIDNTVIIE